MIARRNNVKDHEVLKKARRRQQEKRKVTVKKSRIHQASSYFSSAPILSDTNPIHIPSLDSSDCGAPVLAVELSSFDDSNEFFETKLEEIESSTPKLKVEDLNIPIEIDYEAVLATRSYRKWSSLPEGAEFTYNQRFIKGQHGHEELLIKNIWRRMKYRRDNKDLVMQFKNEGDPEYYTDYEDGRLIHDHFDPLNGNTSSLIEEITIKSTVSPLEDTNSTDQIKVTDSSLAYLENIEHFIEQGAMTKEESEVDFHGITILGV